MDLPCGSLFHLLYWDGLFCCGYQNSIDEELTLVRYVHF
jgi:hypothetical protein